MPMEKVWPMFSLNPSRKYGFERNKGSLKALKDADFVVINDEYRTIATYSMGKKVYDAKEGPVFNPDFLREWRQKEV